MEKLTKITTCAASVKLMWPAKINAGETMADHIFFPSDSTHALEMQLVPCPSSPTKKRTTEGPLEDSTNPPDKRSTNLVVFCANLLSERGTPVVTSMSAGLATGPWSRRLINLDICLPNLGTGQFSSSPLLTRSASVVEASCP